MSEFKYACPVCGQHIKCDSSQAGTVMECPTCFQKITVPNAPAGEDQKFIFTGTKAGEQRPTTSMLAAADQTKAPTRGFPGATVAFLLALMLAAGAGVYYFRDRLPFFHGHWQSSDVGTVGVPGTFAWEGSVMHVAGAGADIWSQTDGFHFVYQLANGDVRLQTRVLGIQNTDPWAKAGLMVRESLSPESPYAMMLVTPTSGLAFQQRTAAGAPATSVVIVPNLRAPYWLRLARHGDGFSADYSADGQNWTSAGTTKFAMAGAAYAGLAVTSHNYATLCQATFDQVDVKHDGPAAAAGAETNASPGNAPTASDANWTLALDTNPIPDAPVAGRIHGQDFLIERAGFQGGVLALRAGAHGPMEFGVLINLSGVPAGELSGKTITVTTNADKAARVGLRWKDADGAVQKAGFESGYALRLEFGQLTNNHLPGAIYLCLPDAERSYLRGSFTAGVSKPKPKAPPKQ